MFEVHACRFTSVTVACALTLDGCGGFTESKSILSVCLPAASVLPLKVCTFSFDAAE